MQRHHLRIVLVVVVLVAGLSANAMACPVCFGETESDSAVGINAAVWVMVGITGTVLSLLSALFLKFRKRLRMMMNGELDIPSNN